MNQVVTFRVLVLVAVSLGLLGYSIDFFMPSLLPATLQEAYVNGIGE